ncbi:hypothetical protein PLICRDRAFT_26857 [Plicaturopsis crispa FD-325 SS-3]|nr:hypothetical protein PLICRDRAFT_26857 [Plicaturopsis crispa FD-325 SS-3]
MPSCWTITRLRGAPSTTWSGQELHLNPFHRAIFVLTDPSPAGGSSPRETVCQVIHGQPIFEYMTGERVTLQQTERYSGRIQIGRVRRKDAEKLEKLLRGAVVVTSENDQQWNCRSWTREGVRVLAEAGPIDAKIAGCVEDEV